MRIDTYRSLTQQHTDSTKSSVLCWERTYNALVSIPLSQHSTHYSTIDLHNKNSVSHDVRINIGRKGKDTVNCLTLGLMHPFLEIHDTVERVACVLIETGDAGSSPHLARWVFSMMFFFSSWPFLHVSLSWFENTTCWDVFRKQTFCSLSTINSLFHEFYFTSVFEI